MTLSALARALIAGLTFLALAGTASLAMAQNAYRIKPGDVLRIEVIEDASLNRSVLVPPDGRITMPLAGSVRAGGRSVGTVQSNLTRLMAPNFATSPSVFVSIERLATPREVVPTAPEAPPVISVYVVGEVNRPGLLSVAPGTTVLQLFAQMGGFTNFAAKKRIQLRRGSNQMFLLDYKSIEAGGTASVNVLADGDVIVVPQRKLFE